MDKKRIYIGIMLMTIAALFLPTSNKTYAEASVHKTIRVGLRSTYSNVSSVNVKNEKLHIGYEQNDRFNSVDILNSSSGYRMLPSKGTYYKTDDLFDSYSRAKSNLSEYNARDSEAIIGYVYPDMWTIYFKDNIEDTNDKIVINEGIEVQDGTGNTMLVADYKEGIPAFVGNANKEPFSLTKLGNIEYRGFFEFVRKSNTMTAVNVVGVEEYLYGVIAAEMPASWDMEALKAQAVAARSMCNYQYNKYINDGYNVCDTVYTQVYKGYSGETNKTNKAVDQTRGEIATYNNKVAETVFFSTSGGHTEDPKYVWGNTVPYLKAVSDPYETEPEMQPWKRTITLDDLDIGLSRSGAQIGNAKGMRINSYTPAGRVKELEIIGTSGRYKVTRENIRTFFRSTRDGSLRSRMFEIEDGQTTSEPDSVSNDIVSINGQKDMQINDIYIQGKNNVGKNGSNRLVVAGRNGTVTYGDSNNNAGSDQITKYGDIVISGKGYGHGVGMSQSGAKGMAKQGYTYEDIIKHYYQGVTLTK